MPYRDSSLPLASSHALSVDAAAVDADVVPAAPLIAAGRASVAFRRLVQVLRRLGKALLVAIGLSLLACIPTMITHLPTALLAPITAGYTTGGILRLTGGECCVLSLAFLLLIGLPLPVAHARFGVLATLGTPAVVFFSAFAAIYYAVLIGAFAWIGGGGLSDDAA